MAGVAAAQQFTISTVAGTPQVPGLFPTYQSPVTIAGTVEPTVVPGPAIGPNGAQLYQPSAITFDSSGDLYIANPFTYVLNMINAKTGQITIVTGTGTKGSGGDGGAANVATITEIGGIATDKNGNVFFSDTGSCRIRRLDNPITTTVPGISTFVGNSSTATAPFCGALSGSPLVFPGALAFDSSGNLYVADYGSFSVLKITSAGTVTKFAGNGSYGYSGDGGSASSAMLAAPVSLAFDSAGNLYIGDEGNSNIRRVDTSGNITTVVKGVTPKGMTVDPTGKFFYFVDGVSNTVKEVLPTGGVVNIAGSGVAGYAGDGTFNGTAYTGSQASQALLNTPTWIATAPDGTLYVSDSGNDIIRHLTVVPSSIGVQDAASEVLGSILEPGSISPGEVLLLFGSGLGPSTLTQFTIGSNGLFPTNIAGTSVTINGTPAPMIYTSSGLVAVIAPYEINGSATANIVLSWNPPGTSVIAQFTASVPVAPQTPAVFTANASGTGQAAATNFSNGLPNSTSNPATRGSIIELYATGAGYTTNPVDGQPAPVTCGSSCQAVPDGIVTVKIGTQTVIPLYAGGAPSLVAGVMQVNVQIPVTVLPGNVLVQVMVNNYPSQPAVSIAVQ